MNSHARFSNLYWLLLPYGSSSEGSPLKSDLGLLVSPFYSPLVGRGTAALAWADSALCFCWDQHLLCPSFPAPPWQLFHSVLCVGSGYSVCFPVSLNLLHSYCCQALPCFPLLMSNAISRLSSKCWRLFFCLERIFERLHRSKDLVKPKQ